MKRLLASVAMTGLAFQPLAAQDADDPEIVEAEAVDDTPLPSAHGYEP